MSHFKKSYPICCVVSELRAGLSRSAVGTALSVEGENHVASAKQRQDSTRATSGAPAENRTSASGRIDAIADIFHL